MALNASTLTANIKKALGNEDVITSMSINAEGNITEEKKSVLKADMDSLIEKIAQEVIKHIKDNLDIYVPGGTVITKVVGQAVGTPNTPAQIKCSIDIPS